MTHPQPQPRPAQPNRYHSQSYLARKALFDSLEAEADAAHAKAMTLLNVITGAIVLTVGACLFALFTYLPTGPANLW